MPHRGPVSIAGVSKVKTICVLFQVKLLVGFHIPRHQRVFKTLHYLFTHLSETRPQELGLGLTWLAVLLTMKQIGKTSR